MSAATGEKVAVIWTNFGPYHIARIQAMRALFEVRAIELASDERLYRWWRGQPDASSYTLTQGCWEDQRAVVVARKLWQLLGDIQPTVILVPGYASLPAVCAAVWGRTHGAETILMSESNYEDRPRGVLPELLKRALVTLLFDGGIVGGTRATSYLKRLGIPEEKIASGYDVVDNDYYASEAERCRTETGQSGKPPYFLFVGRLATEKNIPTLLQAHAQYLEFGGAWPLVVVGDGPLREPLQEQAKVHLRNGKVIFVGHKYIQELPEYYAFAGCLVLPSTREPWGLVVNEAMASGLPVIVSSRCGCADDLVDHGSNGFIVDPENVSEIVAALECVSRMSEEGRMRMASRSRAVIAEYSPEVLAREIQRLTSVL
jgi:1,2-diacylglycerol 3-alpha-glucosyltransferase